MLNLIYRFDVTKNMFIILQSFEGNIFNNQNINTTVCDKIYIQQNAQYKMKG